MQIVLSFSSQIIKCYTPIKTKGTAGLFNTNDKDFTFPSFFDLNQYKMMVKTSHHINYKSILLHVKIEHPQKTKLFPETWKNIDIERRIIK